MRSFLITTLLALILVSPGHAQPNLDGEMKPGALTQADSRFLQGLLAVDGKYSGLLDGNWNDASQRALEQYFLARFGTDQVTWRQIAAISRQFETTLSGGRWVVFFDETTGMSYLLPLSLMVRQSEGPQTSWLDISSQLLIRTHMGTPQATQEQHNWVLQNSVPGDQSIQLRFERQMITAGLLQDRVNTAYVRSFRRQGQFATTLLQWRPQKAAVARLIIASITMGEQAALEMSENGRLRRAIAALAAEESGQASQSETNEPAQPPRADGLVGTGFYVNNTDLVTASVVFDACQGVRLADGTRLERFGQNQVQGLALATSPARSQNWLEIDPQAQAEPGQALATMGLEQDDGGFRGLAQTRGKVEGETLEGNNGLRIIATLRHRLGNDGAPVFDQANRVVGVVVAGPGEYRGPTSTITPVRQLAAMMQRNRVLFATPPTRRGEGTGNKPGQAVVALFCQ